MKKIFIVFSLILFSGLSFSQITITATDVQNHFALGNTYTNMSDTLVTSANIGSTGNFTLDLSSLNFNLSNSSTSVSLSSTGYASEFPGAQYAVHMNLVQPDVTSDVYSFYSLSTDLNSHGVVVLATAQGITSTILSKFLPANKIIQLPLTMGTTWTTDFTDSTYITYQGLPLPPIITASHQTNTYMVDGYGSLTLPGKTLQVLRLQTDTRMVTNGVYSRLISYSFIAQNGESVSISVADTNAANSGVVAVNDISWETSGVVGIRDEVAGITDYQLLNNYPNPFNPSTKISYYVPVESKVEISVYNVMGQKVGSVYNGINTQGLQEVNFNASTLSSGTYFYKMNAASLDGTKTYSSTGKMLLLK